MTNDEHSRRRAKNRADDLRDRDDHGLVVGAGMEQRPELRDASAAELQRRLKKSVDRFSEVSSKQADVMIGLTKRISGLTVAILVLTVVLAVVEVVGCLAD